MSNTAPKPKAKIVPAPKPAGKKPRAPAKKGPAKPKSKMPAKAPLPNKGGRPPHEPTANSRQTVEILSGFGIPQEDIARAMSISTPTLAKHYGQELEDGGAKVQSKLVANLLRLSRGNDGTALKATMFALQSRFGWSMYAAPRDPLDPGSMGKKEIANVAAGTAHVGTGWSGLVN